MLDVGLVDGSPKHEVDTLNYGFHYPVSGR
jgi:hypothetical protein